RYAYLLTCQKSIYDESGCLKELRCTYDPQSKGGQAPDGRKVKGTIHWVSARHAIPAEIRLYDQLFSSPNPSAVQEGKTFLDTINPHSLNIVTGMIEPALNETKIGDTIQFERVGYFCKDKDSSDKKSVFNRTVTLRDSWAKIENKQ
ncbi:MAG: glutamine--tRNA ligase, partial [Desulfovibrio sp.]|nr:glutamine--tRNA ligase [Desulfovibrio sp.]